jgi:hypothetical protein
MLDVNKCQAILENYFATVTPDRFMLDLAKYCPELFDEELTYLDSDRSNGAKLDRQNTEENKLDRYREAVKSLISNYANSDSSNDEVEVQLMLDADRDHYQWMNVGWQGSDRIYRCLMHFDIKDGKIWLQQNLTDRDPAEELVNMGVPKGDIVLGLQIPSKRLYTDYGVA